MVKQAKEWNWPSRLSYRSLNRPHRHIRVATQFAGPQPSGPLRLERSGRGSERVPPSEVDSLEKLRVAIVAAWKEVTVDAIRRSVLQWKQRLNCVVRAEGGAITYVYDKKLLEEKNVWALILFPIEQNGNQ